IVTHRWLGIAGSVLFVTWFVSGIAMMYARMPRLPAGERLLRLAPLSLDAARVEPADAVARLSRPPVRLRMAMLEGRPVYRLFDGAQWTTVFADTGTPVSTLTADAASQIAAHFLAADDSDPHTFRHEGLVREPDQWTLQLRALLPAHKVVFEDAARSHVYVSEQTGEPVLVTTRRARTLGYLGAVMHWLYFTPLRRNGRVWSEVIIWLSVAGCVLCLTGLIWGLWQLVRLRGTPYQGLMRWHLYFGLVFGAVTFTFVFSGLLSMDPWSWSPGTGATPAQRRAVAGGRFAPQQLSLTTLREALAALQTDFAVREIEVIQFRARLFLEAYRPPPATGGIRHPHGDPGDVIAARLPLEHRLVDLTSPERGSFERFDDDAIRDAARAAMPGVPERDAHWLSQYDSYYYDRNAELPLPVLRVRYDDERGTWLYVDPYRGTILRKEERLSRLNRWLYHGLHSLDFPWLYRRRPLWDIVVIVLSVGGLIVSVTSAPAGWRRLRGVFRNGT
ncbi:MAG: hypothetical protein ACREUF_12980, partial [Solimonas sp.]